MLFLALDLMPEAGGPSLKLTPTAPSRSSPLLRSHLPPVSVSLLSQRAPRTTGFTGEHRQEYTILYVCNKGYHKFCHNTQQTAQLLAVDI